MDTEERIHPYLKCLFVQLCRPGTGYTQVGVCLAELSPRGTLQVSLFEEPSHQERDEAAQAALDTLRDRFGREVIQRGSALKAKEKQRPGMGLPVFST
jgi:hypothetical protein